MTPTPAQADLIRKLMSPEGGDLKIGDVIDASPFNSLAIATYMGWNWIRLNKMIKAGAKVADLPDDWKAGLLAKAKEFGVS